MPRFLPPLHGTAREVAARLARAALPPESPGPSPPWLLPGQRVSHARTVAALERFGGAMLAEPVGTGKTYIALAAAHSLAGRATCIAPASLVAQWRRTAAALRLPLVVSSHERASRGVLPRADGLIIVDESHHYRSRGARRYAHLARWIAGRTALLLTATPVINRLGDLIAQLLLVLPDDALAPLGVPSLAELPRRHAFPSAISLVVLTAATSDARPSADARIVRPGTAASDLVADIRALRLSRNPAVARLVRGVLLRAAASSPAAFDACLRRYRLLLLQARDAGEAGARPGRSALRRWAGELPEQTVLWPLLDDVSADAELELGDLESLDVLIRRADLAAEREDATARRLVDLVGDGARTLVFTGSRDTALWLRRWIVPAPAWCTGAAAGIGHTRMPRHSVLAGFAPDARNGASRSPHVLIATDVAAEGLDLQRTRRIVHYDLPWNPARLEQREGRARRLGSGHDVIQVVSFEPPPAIEREIRQLQILEEKRGLGGRARVAGETLERLRGALETAAGSADPIRGTAVVSGVGLAGALIGLTLVELADEHASWGTTLYWLPAEGESAGGVRVATDDATTVTTRLAAVAAIARHATPPSAAELRWLEAAAARPAAAMLRAANAASLGRNVPLPMRRLVRRLATIGRAAARERNEARLAAVDRALRVAARGHSAGEALRIGELAGGASDEGLVEALASFPDRPARSFDVSVEGAVLFRAGGSRLP